MSTLFDSDGSTRARKRLRIQNQGEEKWDWREEVDGAIRIIEEDDEVEKEKEEEEMEVTRPQDVTEPPPTLEHASGSSGFGQMCGSPAKRRNAHPQEPAHCEIRVLELFAGAGGLHLSGSGTFPAPPNISDSTSKTVSWHTVGAVELVDDPADTYSKNMPSVPVYRMGLRRFLATGGPLAMIHKKKGTHIC